MFWSARLILNVAESASREQRGHGNNSGTSVLPCSNATLDRQGEPPGDGSDADRLYSRCGACGTSGFPVRDGQPMPGVAELLFAVSESAGETGDCLRPNGGCPQFRLAVAARACDGGNHRRQAWSAE